MTNDVIKSKWEEYTKANRKHFPDPEEDIWFNNLKQVEEYISIHNEIPNKRDDDPISKYLGKWLSHQIYNYKNKIKSMNIEENVIRWEAFIAKYKDKLMSKDELSQINWNSKMLELEKYIQKYDKRPTLKSRNIDISIINWMFSQIHCYKHKIKNMKQEYYRNKWEEFISKYPVLAS
jgi:hypothetical protein